MKRAKLSIVPISIVLTLSLFSCSKSTTSLPSFSFSYASGKNDDFSSTVYYSDDYFLAPSSTYNPSLATASLCFALSSMSSNTFNVGGDYSHRYINAEKFLGNASFNSLYVNEGYKKKPETDSIGLVYANKKIDGDTMVAIGIRGANYQQEWASNVTLGEYADNSYHKGFYTAAKELLDTLKTYIEAQNITGSIKLWITGYSRAGAVANIASGLLDESILKSNPILGDKVSLTKDDLYSFCFEPPQGVYYDVGKDEVEVHGEGYNNIFNIVSGNDPVPLVAMNVYGFTRFGVDKYLSNRISDKDYSSSIAKIKNVYSNMPDYATNGGEYYIDNFVYKGITLKKDVKHVNWTSGLFLEEFTSTLGTCIGTRSDYVSKVQEGLRNVFALIYKNGAPKGSFIDIGINLVKQILSGDEADVLMDDLMHSSSFFVKDLVPLLQRTLTSSGIEIDVKTIFSNLEYFLSTFVGLFASNPSLIMSLMSSDNVKALASAHYQSLCYANMMARDPNYSSDIVTSDMSGRYYYFESEETSKPFVIKKNGTPVAELRDGNVVDLSSEITYAIDHNKFVAYLPIDKGYSIEVGKGTTASLSVYEPSKIKFVTLSSITPSSISGSLNSDIALTVK